MIRIFRFFFPRATGADETARRHRLAAASRNFR